QVRDSQMKEIEGINPIIFTEFFLENFIFSTLSDIAGDNLPKINEHFISVKGADEQIKGETKLLNDIKQSNALNAAFYNDSVVKHYTNNPFDWLDIPITKKTENGTETKFIQPTNIKEQVLPKEQVLIELCKKE